MMLCYSKTRKIKYFWTPPPQKKAQGLQSNPFIENYYLTIVVFSCPHFSIYDIFVHTKFQQKGHSL